MLETLWQDITTVHILHFLLKAGLLLILGWLVKWSVKLLAKRKRRLKKTFLPVVVSITNWACFYGVILFFLFDFSNNKWLFYPLYTKGGLDVTAFLLIIVIMIVTLAHRLVKLLTKYVLSTVYAHYHVDRGLGYTFNRIIYYTVMIVAVCISFTSVGIDLSALGTILGVVGIGLGFGMRNIAANFVSGMIILFERPIEVGEVVQINDETGRVQKINLRSTTVTIDKKGKLTVPNQYFIEQVIMNRTMAQPAAQITVRVSAEMDTKKVEKVLNEAFEIVKNQLEGLLPGTSAAVRLIDIQHQGFGFLIEIPLENGSDKAQWENDMRHAVIKLFRKNNIELADAPVYLQQP
ncbi:mechanosensitive ion channel family protein [Heyndrickxia acidiproducens]|uniref:mechanosensitive ion channel family protein n=1 Tax=Heyndrickxia acidiproducens TaxID=1121084 RepID=UPI00036581CE|nr:mechanosensitive ion channel domain-containing protein [Heyndrickxia acidiproducens]